MINANLRQKKLFLSLAILFAMLCMLNDSPIIAGDALLAWNANTDPIAGYKVYVGTSSGNYGAPTDVGNQTSYLVTGLNPGVYYFAVTAYNSTGIESPFSSEVLKTITNSTTASRCDVNGDGAVNVLDLQVIINAILAGTFSAALDLNRDGRVDVLDLQVLSTVILGVGTCPP